MGKGWCGDEQGAVLQRDPEGGLIWPSGAWLTSFTKKAMNRAIRSRPGVETISTTHRSYDTWVAPASW